MFEQVYRKNTRTQAMGDYRRLKRRKNTSSGAERTPSTGTVPSTVGLGYCRRYTVDGGLKQTEREVYNNGVYFVNIGLVATSAQR